MAKKKNITEQDIQNYYMDHILENGSMPNSVYTFAKNNNFDELVFYDYFGSFDALEKNIFKSFFDRTHEILHKSDDYNSFSARNRLLSFYYTFFEILTANRSFVYQLLYRRKDRLKSLTLLSGLKRSFTHYISELDINTMDLKQKKLLKFQDKAMKESAWLQLLLTIRFWLDDSSPSFEKTDIFIEKSVNTSFDLLDTKPLKSIIDFGKFLYHEKIGTNM